MRRRQEKKEDAGDKRGDEGKAKLRCGLQKLLLFGSQQHGTVALAAPVPTRLASLSLIPTMSKRQPVAAGKSEPFPLTHMQAPPGGAFPGLAKEGRPGAWKPIQDMS